MLLTGCGGGGGGEPGPDPGPGGGDMTATVYGTVLDAAQGDQPLAGATVEIGGKTATTVPANATGDNTDVGAFRIEGTTVGANTAVVTPPNGTPQTVFFSPALVTGQNGPIELIVNIAQVQGRILRADGQPAGGAFVAILATGESHITNADGVFTFEAIPAGPTEITAVLGTQSLRYEFNVAVGLNNLNDLTLLDDPNPDPPGPPSTIIGTISITGDNAPGAAANLNVQLFRNGLIYREATTNSVGDYSFYVPVGNYEVRINKPGYRPHVGNISVADPSNPVRADIALVAP